MSDASQLKPRKGYTWVVVADAARADFYNRVTRRSPPELMGGFAEPRARGKEQDFAADAPGRSFDSSGRNRHAMEPDHTVKQHLRETFAQQIAAALEEGRQAGHYTQLIIVAAPAMLGELRHQLSDPTGKLVVAEYSKDLAGHDAAAVAALIDS